MTIEKYTLLVLACVFHDCMGNPIEKVIVQAEGGEVELTQKIDEGSWGRAKYKNNNTVFDFDLVDKDRTFFTPYSVGVGSYYKFDLGPLGRAADFQCFYVDMKNGCITKESFGGDCASSEAMRIEDLDSRLNPVMKNADFAALKRLNGDRTETVCGVTQDASSNVKIIDAKNKYVSSLSRHSSEVRGLNGEWVEGLAHKSDVNMDGINDSIVYFYNNKVPSNIKFVISLSKGSGYEIFSTPEIDNFGCGGSCWIYDLYFKSGSLFLLVNEKTGDGNWSARYQFKDKSGQWVLIGFKNSYTRRESDEEIDGADAEIEEVVKDVNWLTGNYIKTTKYTDSRVERANKIITTKSVLFNKFDFELGANIE